MNPLLEKYNDYKSISGFVLQYILSNDDRIDVTIKRNAFPHLIGLHKLDDIPIIEQWQDRNTNIKSRNIIRQIKEERILSDEIIRGSVFFDKIATRYESFSKDMILDLSYSDAIINFDKTKVGSLLKADYILFDDRKANYKHLAIAKDEKDKRYIETYFVDETDAYKREQIIVPIQQITIYDAKGKVYLQDSFDEE